MLHVHVRPIRVACSLVSQESPFLCISWFFCVFLRGAGSGMSSGCEVFAKVEGSKLAR